MPPGLNRPSQIPRLIRPYHRGSDQSSQKGTNVKPIPKNNRTSNSFPKPKSRIQETTIRKEEMNTFSLESLQDAINAFDEFLIDAYNSSIVDATESFLSKKLNADLCVYYIDVPNIEELYSPTLRMKTPRKAGLVGYSYFSQSLVRTSKPSRHPSFHPPLDDVLLPQDSPVILAPLIDYRDNLTSVVEIIRSPGSPEFTDEDELWVKLFQHKFKIYSRFILRPPANEPLLLDLLQVENSEKVVPKITGLMQNYFGCESCEIWRFNTESNTCLKFGRQNNTEFQVSDSGIVGHSLLHSEIINIPSTKFHDAYNETVDGLEDQYLLVVPVETTSEEEIYGIALRGCHVKQIFTPEDENALIRVAPFIVLSIINSSVYSEIENEFERSRAEREGLAALLEVAEILSGQLEIDRLTEVIMEKGRQLTHADRCSLFLVSPGKDRLITSFQRGLKNAIDIPIDKGIAGQTVSENRVINIDDAYKCPQFDNTTDQETGYKTRSILSVPIVNNRGEVIGVTEMVNKLDLAPFTKWDAHLIQIFNVFCGISLENSRLYRQSIDMSQQLRSFFDVSLTLTESGSTKKVLQDIITNARKTVGARRASLFLVDETNNTLSSYITDGKLPATLPIHAGIVGTSIKSKQIIVCNDAYSDPHFNRTVDQITGYKTNSLLAAPIIGQNGAVIGVVEMVNKENGVFGEKDMNLLMSFATFAAVSLENSRLKDIAELGSAEIEINKYVGESERQGHEIPNKLVLTDEQKKVASSLNFFSVDFKGIGHIKILFYLFNKFNILERFSITNEMFFRFVFEIRATYHDVPYHNWMHAVDVTEYVSYEIETAKLANVFTPLEIFALLLSAVCHDAGHDGFNNLYNEKTETPLGILFKNQSVMETHHCTVAINKLTQDDTNLLHSLSTPDNRKMWNWIIKLILATDMAHHFKMVKETGAMLDENKFDMNNPDHRLLAMQLLLKVADISNVSRPFKLADKWCDILSQEFFRQGDNELANGLELSSPLNDRNNQDKPKGQIGFYNFVCLPLYQVVARLFPPLEVNLNSVKSNLEVWKSLTLTQQK